MWLSLKYLFIIPGIGIAIEFRFPLDTLLVLGLYKQKVKYYANSISFKYILFSLRKHRMQKKKKAKKPPQFLLFSTYYVN